MNTVKEYTAEYTYRQPQYRNFDTTHYLLYLNEKEVEIIPNHEGEEKELTPVPGYSYTGNNLDGGTLIEATEPTRDAFINGLIRLRYSVDSVEAIQNNRIAVLINKKHEKAEEYTARWDELQAYREECKEAVDALLSRTVEMQG